MRLDRAASGLNEDLINGAVWRLGDGKQHSSAYILWLQNLGAAAPIID